MTTKTMVAQITKFIDCEILPKATLMERSALIGGAVLGVVDMETMVAQFLKSPMLAGTKIWIDEEAGEVSVTILRTFADRLLESYGGRCVYDGLAYDLGFKKITLFGGFVIDETFVETLFSYLDSSV